MDFIYTANIRCDELCYVGVHASFIGRPCNVAANNGCPLGGGGRQGGMGKAGCIDTFVSTLTN